MKKLLLSLLLAAATVGSAVAQHPSQRLRLQAEKLKAANMLPSLKAQPRAAKLPGARALPKQNPAKGVRGLSSDTITLNLSQPQNPTTFTYDAKGCWDSIYDYKTYPFIEFNAAGTMAFSHKNTAFETHNALMAEYDDEEFVDDMMAMIGMTDGYWDGFTISTNGDSSMQYPFYGNDRGNMACGGIVTDAEGRVVKNVNGKVQVDKSIPYLVGYVADVSWIEGYMGPGLGPSSPAAQTLLYEPGHAVGMYVNAAPYTYHSVRDGDGFARALNQEGDYLKLLIHGLNENYEDNGRVVEYYLAKYENDSLYQSADWEYVDLSALGEVSGFYYTMESTDESGGTPTYFCMDKLQVTKVPPHTFSITVPEGAKVAVSAPGYSGYNYKPFTTKEAVYTSTAEGRTAYYYNLTGKHAYRVQQQGKLTHVGAFTPSKTATSIEVTAAQLASHSPKEVNRDVTANNGYNVADIFMNINAKGHLQLQPGDTHQLVHLRSWTLVDNTVSNYFLEPDYHYTVINESGEPDNSVLTVDSTGKLTAVGAGAAIVLVSYDAVSASHAAGGPFFGALWAENTGVFVVEVENKGPIFGFISNMTINDTMNTTNEHKLAGTAVDAELDVFYYLEEKGGYDYTFTPSGTNSVLLAQPTVGDTMTSYSGFSANGVTANEDGSYTVRLVKGRNIVKLSSGTDAIYQVLTAKPVSYTLSNLTHPDEEFSAGDEVSVKFSTLYHPCNKLAGVYNMSAGIQYNGVAVQFRPVGGPNQYTFAGKAQEYKIKIPQEFTGNEFVLAAGVIKADGFGKPYGNHRDITLEAGASLDFAQLQRQAYFGALPVIHIPVKDVVAPSTPTNLVGVPDTTSITLTWAPSTDNIGVAGYTVYVDGDSVATVTDTAYTVEGLSAATQYAIQVAAFDATGNVSEKALVDISTTEKPTAPINTGVAKQESTFSVFPNPFTDYVEVEAAADGKAAIYNLAGQLVLEQSIAAGSNRLQLAALPKGVYLLRIGKTTVKIVK